MEHRNNFDALRLLAAIFVWYSHCYALYGLPADPLNARMPLVSFGELGVAIFFVISGYFITASYDRHQSLAAFLINRCLRIFPALAVVVVLTILMGALVTRLSFHDYFSHSDTWRYLRSILVFPLQYDLPGVFTNRHPTAVNGSLWSLQHEVRCYIGVGLLGVLGLLRRSLITWLWVIFVAIYLCGALPSVPPEKMFTVRWPKLENALPLASFFLAGAILYVRRDTIKLHFIGAVIAAGLLYCLPHMAWAKIFCGLPLAYLVMYLGQWKVISLWELTRKADISYGFYLYAFPIQQLTLHVFSSTMSFTSFVVVSFLLTFACATASWFWVEKPFLRLKS